MLKVRLFKGADPIAYLSKYNNPLITVFPYIHKVRTKLCFYRFNTNSNKVLLLYLEFEKSSTKNVLVSFAIKVCNKKDFDRVIHYQGLINFIKLDFSENDKTIVLDLENFKRSFFIYKKYNDRIFCIDTNQLLSLIKETKKAISADELYIIDCFQKDN